MYFPTPKPNFVNRFLCNTDPDRNDYFFRVKIGEFSIHTEIAFERHLNRLKKFPKIQPPKEALV